MNVVAEITKKFTFEAAHRLPMVPPTHKCSRVHGHSFEIVVTIRGPIDPRMGWIVDFAALSEAWAPLHALVDHRLLNDVDGLSNPTSENLAQWILDRFKVDGVQVVEVRVAETCTSSCRLRVVD